MKSACDAMARTISGSTPRDSSSVMPERGWPFSWSSMSGKRS